MNVKAPVLILLAAVLVAACAHSEDTRIETRPAIGNQADKPAIAEPIAPFSSNQDRYRRLAADLLNSGITRDRIRTLFTSARAKQKDMTAVDRLSVKRVGATSLPSTKPFDAIVDALIKHIGTHKTSYDAVERRFGVNREIAAAILFKETRLGAFSDWRHEAFTVFNSLLSFLEVPADADERRKKRIERLIDSAHRNLRDLILYSENNGIDIITTPFPSSFAGAIGMPQFLPMYLDYAISDHHTPADLTKTADALLSLGNLLNNRFHWLAPMQLERLRNIDEIATRYARYDRQTRDASFCMSQDQEGYPLRNFSAEFSDIADIDYIAGYCNVLMQYNFSSYYVLDVLRIAFHTHRRLHP